MTWTEEKTSGEHRLHSRTTKPVGHTFDSYCNRRERRDRWTSKRHWNSHPATYALIIILLDGSCIAQIFPSREPNEVAHNIDANINTDINIIYPPPPHPTPHPPTHTHHRDRVRTSVSGTQTFHLIPGKRHRLRKWKALILFPSLG